MKAYLPTDTGVRLCQHVRFGGVVARLEDWAWLCGASPRGVRNRILRGECVLDALRPKSERRVELRFEMDREVRRLVQDNPGGMTSTEVGEHFGLTRARIAQIEAEALAKLVHRLSSGCEGMAA